MNIVSCPKCRLYTDTEMPKIAITPIEEQPNHWYMLLISSGSTPACRSHRGAGAGLGSSSAGQGVSAAARQGGRHQHGWSQDDGEILHGTIEEDFV